jgi:hypothetical protein
MEEIKRINIKEFREKGYLQELNRRFLHPLGLALEIIDDNGIETLGGIWDYREDKEGMYYDISNSDIERKNRFIKNKLFIDNEFEQRFKERKNILGFDIEPLDI